MDFAEILSSRYYNGYQKVYQHKSMKSNEMNFIEKTGFQRYASEHQVIVVNTDSSPRGKVIDKNLTSEYVGETRSYYLDSTKPEWVKLKYFMYSYIIKELIPLIFDNFPVDKNKCGIFGHSMGGHGALTIGLKNPSIFKSISSLAAVCNPLKSRLTVFQSYLGNDPTKWSEYDSVELAKKYDGPKRRILVDQGSADHKLKELLPENLLAVENSNIEWDYRLRTGYDHFNFYVATFIQEHFEHFMQQIKNFE